jgi:D-serine deaminase-like pyridoxal phosphate-dependent protein
MQDDLYWFDNIEKMASPALVIYPSLIARNIRLAKEMAKNAVLRPHVKTNKTAEVVKAMIAEGIVQFKCATIAEAEMLAMAGAADILLAYQPVEQNMYRISALKNRYPDIVFSCLVDNLETASKLSGIFIDSALSVYIDVNVGMNRTGILPAEIPAFAAAIILLKGITLDGLHAYDGHLHELSADLRKNKSAETYALAQGAREIAEKLLNKKINLVIGGTLTFPYHAQRPDTQCSPGTFVFWDAGYAEYTDLPFTIAAVLITRIISIVNKQTICLDAGYKAVASENLLARRIRFMHHPEATVKSHSEEHLVVEVADSSRYKVGDVWFAVPIHICPTVAMYNQLEVVENGHWIGSWQVVARDRKITV